MDESLFMKMVETRKKCLWPKMLVREMIFILSLKKLFENFLHGYNMVFLNTEKVSWNVLKANLSPFGFSNIS